MVWCGGKQLSCQPSLTKKASRERELDKNCDKKLLYNNNDFDNKCIKSVQFGENWDLIALNMVKIGKILKITMKMY